jgi:hypothetical protein
MPLTDELGNRIRREDSEPLEPPWWYRQFAGQFADGSFERWLSNLAEPQPYLDDYRNTRQAAAFELATRLIHQELGKCEHEATRIPQPPTWLTTLVRLMHVYGEAVVTFNYDTLIEQATTTLLCAEPHLIPTPGGRPAPPRVVPAFRGQRVPLATPTNGPTALPIDSGMAPSFRLIKLHGSPDTFWVRGDTSGATIVRLRPWAWGKGGEVDEAWDPDLMAPGRVPFIVPPASAKSAYYNNPVTRQLWRDAAEVLGSSSHVALVGYSLPLTDLITVSMLQYTLAGTAGPERIQVVNPVPDRVVESLTKLGVATGRVQVFKRIGDWVDELLQEYDP